MNAQEQKLIETVNDLSDDIVDFTCRLVAQASILENEAGAVDVMTGELNRLGFSTELVPLKSEKTTTHPGFAPVPWSLEERNNIVGTLHPAASGGRSALFNGHLDVVSAGNETYWTRAPYSPTVEDGWLYGRGAGDMKSGVAAMTYAAYAINRAGFGLCAPLTVEAVIEEECSGNGAIACLAAGHDAEAILIPEPFGPTIQTDQLGVLWFKVSISGRPVHVLEALAGVNAIEKCYALINGLRELELQLNQGDRPKAYADKEHPINLNIGIIEGGDWPSTVPAEAGFKSRLSFFPGMPYPEICNMIKETIRMAAQNDDWLRKNPPTVEFFGFRSEGHSVSRNLPALTTLDDCHKSLVGSPAESYIATCTTDLRAFHWYGKGQATCFGPVAENIHGIDERVELESVIHVARTYALFLARWCLLTE